jgi:hypothetical protein
MGNKNLHLVLILFLFTVNANAQWNPFKKKTAEDCILEKIKDTRGEDAVRALQQSCYMKYDMASSSSGDDKFLKEKVKREKKCDLDADAYKYHHFFAIIANSKPSTQITISNIKRPKYNQQANTIEFQNNNSFGLSGVFIGFLNGKNCTSNKNDYEVTTYCSRGTKEGISPGSYGKLPCGSVPSDAARLGFCVLGYSPIYDQFNDDLLIFKEKNGLCNQ